MRQIPENANSCSELVARLVPGGPDMTSPEERLPELDELFQAADSHADAASDPDYAVGDLQEILRAAWRVLTPAQLTELFAQPELAELAELDEYGQLIGH